MEQVWFPEVCSLLLNHKGLYLEIFYVVNLRLSETVSETAPSKILKEIHVSLSKVHHCPCPLSFYVVHAPCYHSNRTSWHCVFTCKMEQREKRSLPFFLILTGHIHFCSHTLKQSTSVPISPFCSVFVKKSILCVSAQGSQAVGYRRNLSTECLLN